MKNIDQKFSFSILKTFTEEIFISLLLVVCTQLSFAQVNENFDDGNFLENPVWSGTNEWFDASGKELHLKAPQEAGTAYLSTPSRSLLNATWQFHVTLQFNPSGSNFSRLYLTSDQADLTGSLKGYFVLLGGSTDEISLFKQNGTTVQRLIDGRDGALNLSETSFDVRVTRDAMGNWNLSSNVEAPEVFTTEGSAFDNEILDAAYTGVWCRYTATRSDKFIFDNISVTGVPYIPAPPATYKDVLITEFFFDPSPRQDLPEFEFVEIYNASEQEFNLSGWTLSDGTQSAEFPNTKLDPHQYLIVTTTAGAENFAGFGITVGLTKFPSLNNSADHIILKNENGALVDSIYYDATWLNEDSKRDGGWSFELIDIHNTCGEEDNWAFSESERGGTPGAVNSIAASKPDLKAPVVLAVMPLSDSVLLIAFDEKLNAEIPAMSCFVFEPAINFQSISFFDHTFRKIKLQSNQKLQSRVKYNLTVTNIRDCAGNIMNTPASIVFGLPEPADKGDVVINEILFNPRPTGVDFVELLNKSDKYINLKDWALATIDDGGKLSSLHTVSNVDYLMPPGRYLAITTNGKILKSEYLRSDESNFLMAATMPSLPDDEGHLVMMSSGNIMDELHYTKEMHSAFIKDEEGVSLERISTSSISNQNNWASASADVGFATPGYRNSNSYELADTKQQVTVDPEIFLPGKGQPGFTLINYRFETGGKIGNVKIFDSQGHLVRDIANNYLLGTEGFFRWDGDRADGTRARVGYYMVWFEVFDGSGNVDTIRRRLAIASEF